MQQLEPSRRGQTSRTGRAALFAAVIAVACGRPRESPRPPPDVLLITIDTLRADRLGCYGDAEARTPELDRLAAGGVRFASASAVAPITLPSHASLLTGRYPSAHGVRNNGTYVLPDAERTLAETLRDAGYRTGAFVGAYPLAHAFGLGQGFERYDDRFADGPSPATGNAVASFGQRRAGEVTDAALAWLGKLPTDAPVFTWVHYFDPHADYAPPPPFDREMADPYRGEIAYTDQQIGRLLAGLDALGRRQRTLIVATADHGEAFGEHGERQHGLFIYETTIRVPLIVAGPWGIKPGTVVEEPVSLVDVVPTVAALVGVEVASSVQGVDLAKGLLGGAVPSRPGVLSETMIPHLEFGWAGLFAVRVGEAKLIAAPRPELYDLAADPGETANLHPIEAAEVERLETILAELRASAGPVSPAGRVADLDALERLRDLGYLAADSSAPASVDDLAAGADPKDRIAVFDALLEANRQARTGGHALAVAMTREVLEQDPDNPFLQRQLATTSLLAGDLDGAAELYAAMIARNPADCGARQGMARVVDRRGELKATLDAYRAALACDDHGIDLLLRLAELEEQAGDAAAALGRRERALTIDPRRADVRRWLADRYAEQGRAADAARLWEEALVVMPGSTDSRNAMGLIDLRAGRFERARDWFQRAQALDPSDFDANANLAALALAEGRDGEAADRLAVVVAARPQQLRPRVDLALALTRSGQLARAVTTVAELTSADPDPTARPTLAALERELAAAGEAQAAGVVSQLVAGYQPGAPN